MLEPDLSKLEAMVAEAETRASELRPTASSSDRYPGVQASLERLSSILINALALTEADRSELDRLGREHDAELRRFADNAKRLAIEGSAEASQRLDAVVMAERATFAALPDDDWRNPWVPSWPPVYFIRSSPGGSLLDSHVEDAHNWAKWQCTTGSPSRGSEKLSFFHLWQNPKDSWALADISVRLNLTGHLECSADGWGLPAGWWTESRSDADVSARLAVWPLWVAHDASQPPQHSINLARLAATAGVFSSSEQTSINQSVLVRTVRFAIPAEAFILIEAGVVLDHAGSADVDFASGDFRIDCPYCFVILPTDVNMNL